MTIKSLEKWWNIKNTQIITAIYCVLTIGTTQYIDVCTEQNSLSINQVSDVIDGKRVLGPPQDIREVKNAYEAYEIMTKLDPYSVKDLLKAHKIMMAGLVKEAGMFRSKGVGVYAGDQLIHASTPANYVPDLIGQLFDWLKKSKLHPLVKSCIFHYEFEFIHPFADGNGRTGRLWHTLILAKWQEFFLWIPIESIIHERQDGYYKALNAANTAGESTIFVEFMLELIRDLLKELASGRAFATEKTSEEKVLDLIREGEKLSAAKMAERLGLSQRQVQRILKQLKDGGVIEYVGANRNGTIRLLHEISCRNKRRSKCRNKQGVGSFEYGYSCEFFTPGPILVKVGEAIPFHTDAQGGNYSAYIEPISVEECILNIDQMGTKILYSRHKRFDDELNSDALFGLMLPLEICYHDNQWYVGGDCDKLQ